MKRRDLVRLFKSNGWWPKRSGGNHEIWTNGVDREALLWTREIPEPVAQAIIKRRGLV